MDYQHKDMKRGDRRAERERKIEQRLRDGYWGSRSRTGQLAEWMGERHRGMVARTPATCSCSVCGNPRRTYGLSLIERSDAEWMRVQFKDVQDASRQRGALP